MSAAFEGYEKQYCELSANLAKKWSSASLLDGELLLDSENLQEQKKQKIFETNTGIDQAEALIRKMDIEARGLQPNIKAVLLAKLREYKSDLNNLKSNVKRIASSNLNQAARDELLEAGMADTLAVSANQRDRLLMSTERLNNSSNRIRESRKVMLETEELGVSLLHDLHQQRQSLMHANNTLHGVDDNISRSRKIITNISRRMDRNKWIIGTIITLLIIAIAVILYFKLVK
ncbi:vesicle transport v-SNARE family protein [Striga asiatica]|uniref:Vesicle transport v-SNARE family protein n=1 Tax=Striga asiatica TaxID=4170 RepID=A0A5A7Q864_STRAF|nr:vesicle transport v-SNARE family protein [Striga asiatica]